LPLTVFIASDADPGALIEHLEIDKIDVKFVAGTSVADLATLAATDIILPSISSFSMLAIFLGRSNYLWHKDHLNENGGWYGIWSHEFDESDPLLTGPRESLVFDAATSRGWPFREGEDLDELFVSSAERSAHTRDWKSDLIYYGQVRSPSRP
jgi:hypothetical protein